MFVVIVANIAIVAIALISTVRCKISAAIAQPEIENQKCMQMVTIKTKC